MKKLLFLLAGLAWILAVVLVAQMLSGTFETRACQTVCVQMIYVTSFLICVVGLIVGWAVIKKPRPHSVFLANIVLSGLMLIYLVTMAIGTFT